MINCSFIFKIPSCTRSKLIHITFDICFSLVGFWRTASRPLPSYYAIKIIWFPKAFLHPAYGQLEWNSILHNMEIYLCCSPPLALGHTGLGSSWAHLLGCWKSSWALPETGRALCGTLGAAVWVIIRSTTSVTQCCSFPWVFITQSLQPVLCTLYREDSDAMAGPLGPPSTSMLPSLHIPLQNGTALPAWCCCQECCTVLPLLLPRVSASVFQAVLEPPGASCLKSGVGVLL